MINLLLMKGNHCFIVVRNIILNLVTLRLSKHKKKIEKRDNNCFYFKLKKKTIIFVFLNNNFFTGTV